MNNIKKIAQEALGAHDKYDATTSAQEKWTAQWLLNTFGCSDIIGVFKKIADAHNASIK